mgnify:CR=1 FL=1
MRGGSSEQSPGEGVHSGSGFKPHSQWGCGRCCSGLHCHVPATLERHKGRGVAGVVGVVSGSPAGRAFPEGVRVGVDGDGDGASRGDSVPWSSADSPLPSVAPTGVLGMDGAPPFAISSGDSVWCGDAGASEEPGLGASAAVGVDARGVGAGATESGGAETDGKAWPPG